MRLLSALFARKAGRAPAPPDDERIAAWVRDAYDCQVRGRGEEAQRLFHQVLEHEPQHPDALFFLGAIAAEEHRELEAIHYLEQAVAARPADATIHFALGTALFNLGRFEDAVPYLRATVNLAPDHPRAVGNLWMASLESSYRGGRRQEEDIRREAEQARAAGRLEPYCDIVLAAIYRNHGRADDSIAASRRLLEIVPDQAMSYSDLLMTLNYSERSTPQSLYAEHQRFAARFATPYVAPPVDRDWPRKLRIGYVSPDFRAHVVALFFEPILAHHDRGRFEIFCYYNHRRDDEFTAQFRAAADRWLDCVDLPDADLADRIRADRIDILVDLAGHTGHNRLTMFAMKPAPVQVTYLGYPNTTGLAAIDYRVTDARADPPGEADRLSAEKLVRLPDCFHCYRPRPDSPDVTPPPVLAAGHITFGCFNNFAKLSPGFYEAAAQVLKAVPGSRLWLKGVALDTPYVVEGVRQRFSALGIEPERLELSGWRMSFGDHLSSYGAVDIALDCFPYNGTTTTCEALWMGVPVVTLAGNRHAARVGVSLLQAAGLNELIATDVAQYVAIAKALAGDTGRLVELRRTLRDRMRASPLLDEARFTRALEHSYLQMWEAKLAEGTAAAGLDADGARALLQAAATHRARGRLAQAAQAYEEILGRRPDDVEAVTALWDIAFESGNPGAVIDWLNKAISARGDVAAFHYMLGCCLQAQGRMADAVASFERAIGLDPRHVKAHNNLGCTLEALGDVARALEHYRRAVALDPALAVAHYNEGNAHRQLGDLVAAIAAIRRALAIDRAHADWHSNLGDLLLDRLELDDALASYRAALAIDPKLARAWYGLGLVLLALGRPDEAEDGFRTALQHEPGLASAHGSLLLALHYRKGEDRAALRDEHAAYARRHSVGAWPRAARNPGERRLRGRLRIGYVSPDLQRHPVARFIEPVLAAHDRARVQVFCYYNARAADDVTRRLQGLCEHWRDIAPLTDEQVAERIRFDGIDILVDLAGHTGGGRLLLFANKPAPVQVTWLGYPDTTGLEAVDYRLTDAWADPPGEADPFHVEKLVRLPRGFLCYQPPADSPEPAAPPSDATGRVTFGSFNHLAKVTPRMVALWSRVLRRVPGAQLVVKGYGLAADSARRDLAERFAAEGVAGDRLRLLPPEADHRAHLECYGEIDVALDTHPYNGTTTTCEALWMGVPVITLCGRAHVSRVGLSLLTQAGLAELVAGNEDEYVEHAVALAQDGERRRALRRDLRHRLAGSPLTDAARFTRELEAAFHDMWATYARQETAMVRLHIGGIQKRPGWKILNIQPGPDVDFVGDCSDLGQFADESVDEIYASHVVEHLGYTDKLPRTLREFRRILKPGGIAKISVPDFEVLCRLFLDPARTKEERFFIMRMAFGGQVDPYDFHYVGLTYEILSDCLLEAGFSQVERAGEFGLFQDDSTIRYAGVPISLNVIAHR